MVKQVLVIRNDLNMRKGKMVAQGAHASQGAMPQATREDLFEWYNTGCTKIVVYVKSLDELVDVYHAAQEANLPRTMVEDAGRTEFKEPTFTAVGIGPAPSDAIDLFTGTLPLL